MSLSSDEKIIHFPFLNDIVLLKIAVNSLEEQCFLSDILKAGFEEMEAAAFSIINLALATARALTAALSLLKDELRSMTIT